MKNTEFLTMREKVTKARWEMCDAKGVEYTKGSDDRHANFKRIGELLNLSPVQVLMVYLQKHLDAIYHGLRVGEAGTERMTDRFMDAQNYLDLLQTLVEEMGGVTETRFRPGAMIQTETRL